MHGTVHVTPRVATRRGVARRGVASEFCSDLDLFGDGWRSGDPMMYEAFWRGGAGERATIVIPGWQTMSYFSDVGSLCWFLEPGLEREVRRLHRLVGNAVADGYHVLVGTGSTQLFQAALYALSPPGPSAPMNVVSPAPYYSVINLSIRFHHFQSNLFFLFQMRNFIVLEKGSFIIFGKVRGDAMFSSGIFILEKGSFLFSH